MLRSSFYILPHIFDWSLGFAVPWAPRFFAPSPSMGSRFFFLCSSAGSVCGALSRKHSTGSRPPVQVRSLNSPHSSQVGTWVGSSEGKWFFQSAGSIFPVSKKRWICRAVYFMMVVWESQGFMRFGWIKEAIPFSYTEKGEVPGEYYHHAAHLSDVHCLLRQREHVCCSDT